MGYKISDLKSVPAGLADSLEALGLGDTEQALLVLSDPAELSTLATQLGVSEAVLGALANRADLLRVPGIGPAYTDLLNAAGVNSIADLRAAGPDLADKLTVAAGTLGVKGVPTLAEVTAWIYLAQSMEDAGDWAVSVRSAELRSHFTDDEWLKIKLAPLAAAAMVIGASPSGSTGTAAEEWGAAVAVNKARAATLPESLINVAFPEDLSADAFAAFMDTAPAAGLLDTIRAATDLVRRSAAVGERVAYEQMIANVAYEAAYSAREGGFLGIGQKLVSDEEQAVLDEIYAAAGI